MAAQTRPASSTTDQPYIELLTGGADLGDIKPHTFHPSTLLASVIARAIVTRRDSVIEQAKTELAKGRAVTLARFIEVLDLVGAVVLRDFNTLVGPAAAMAYQRAYQDAGAGDVPISTIYSLAEAHTQRLGTYYHQTSKDAMVQGFNTYVNRQLPARVAAERVLDAYGMTPRQVRGYTSLKPSTRETVTPLDNKTRLRTYIGTSIRRRAKIFGEQEAHNVSEQAKQTAWLWMQDKGILGEEAEKVWLTARDEKTCKVCGPMHGKRAKLGERFTLPNGIETWVAGVHPNCRCVVRVTDLSAVKKSDDRWYNDELPRTSDGRFSRYRQAMPKEDRQPKYKAAERTDVSGFQGLLDEMFTEPAEKEKIGLREETLGLRSSGLGLRDRGLGINESSAKFTLNPVGPKEKIGLSGKRDRLHEPRERLGLSEEHKERIELGLRDMFVTPPPAPTQARHRATINLIKENGVPAFAIIDGGDEEIFDHDGRVHLDESIIFYTDEEEVVREAQKQAEMQRQWLWDRISHEDLDIYEQSENADGGLVEKRLSYGAINAALEYIALTGSTGPENDHIVDEAHKQLVPLEVFEDEYYTGEEFIPVNEVAFHLSSVVSPEDLRVRVIRLVEGYADERDGMTWEDETGTRTANARWKTRGTYSMLSMGREIFPGDQVIERYDLVPEIEDEIVYTDIPTRLSDD